MALFKILKGKSGNLPKTYTEGYCYVTTDEHKLYVDSDGTSAGRWALNAETAEKLTTSAGSATQPIFFSDGKPLATTYTLEKSVPSDALFTDTNTWRGIQDNLTSTSTTDSLSAKQGKILKDGLDTANAKFADYLPLSAGGDKKLIGPLGLTEDINYGPTLPTSGFTGQIFYLEEEESGPSLPIGGSEGQYLVKNSSTDGDASWKDLPSLDYLPLTGGTVTGITTFSDVTDSSSTTTGAVQISGGLGVAKNIYGDKVYGAVWNDYAEYRICNEGYSAGRVVCENGDDTLSVASYRLQPGANIVSDTFGFAIGKTEEAKCPIAVSGRVLAFPAEPRSSYAPGDPVCAGPNGTVSKMTREEVREYPDRIVGTVSVIPNYEFWGEGKVPVAGRIWIKVR